MEKPRACVNRVQVLFFRLRGLEPASLYVMTDVLVLTVVILSSRLDNCARPVPKSNRFNFASKFHSLNVVLAFYLAQLFFSWNTP